MAKKLTDAEKIAEIVKVLKANGFTLPPSLDPPKDDEG